MTLLNSKQLSALALLGALVFGSGMAIAEDNNPLATAAHGTSDVAKGVANVLVTPAVMVNDLANGRPDNFVADTLTMPVRAIASAGAGIVEVVGGLGGGASQAAGNFLNGAADATKSFGDEVNADSPAAKLMTTTP